MLSWCGPTMQRVASRHQAAMFSNKEISESVFDLACFVMMYWATANGPIKMCKLTWKKLFWKREKDSPGVKESLKIIISLLDMWITWPMRSDGVIVATVQVGAVVAFEFTVYSRGSSLLCSHFLTVYPRSIRKHCSVLFKKVSARQLFARASTHILPFFYFIFFG